MSISLMTAVFYTEFFDLPRPGVDEKDKMTKASTAKIVLLAIADQANDEGKSSYPGFKKLMLKTGLSRQGLADTLEGLAYNGIISIADEKADKYGTNNYSINTECLTGGRNSPQRLTVSIEGSQATRLVKPLDEGSQATLQEVVKPLDHKHPLNAPKTSSEGKSLKLSGIEAAIFQGRPVVESDLPRRTYLHRERMPEAVRDLMDVFFEETGINCTSLPDWILTGNQWLELGAARPDVRKACERARPDENGRGGLTNVTRPGSITGLLNAVIGERNKTGSGETPEEMVHRLARKHG